MLTGSGQWPNPPILPGAALSVITPCVAHILAETLATKLRELSFLGYTSLLNFLCVLKQEWLEKVTGQGFLESDLACISIND